MQPRGRRDGADSIESGDFSLPEPLRISARSASTLIAAPFLHLSWTCPGPFLQVCFDLDRGSVDGKLLAPLPPALASLLEQTLRAPAPPWTTAKSLNPLIADLQQKNADFVQHLAAMEGACLNADLDAFDIPAPRLYATPATGLTCTRRRDGCPTRAMSALHAQQRPPRTKPQEWKKDQQELMGCGRGHVTGGQVSRELRPKHKKHQQWPAEASRSS